MAETDKQTDGFHHTGEKPFKCNFCEMGLTKKGNLTRHDHIYGGHRHKTAKFSFCVTFLLAHFHS